MGLIAIIVLFLMFCAVAGVVMVVVVLALRSRPNSLEGTQALPGPSPVVFPTARALPPAATNDEHRRTIAAEDYTFDKLTRSMQQVDFALQGAPGPEVAPGEPASATFVSGSLTAHYRFDPSTHLRMIDITGPNARTALNDLLNVAYLPTIEGYKVSGMLEASDAPTLLKAIRAAEFISINGDEKFYINPVGKLTSHPEPNVAAEARRVHQVLASKQAGR